MSHQLKRLGIAPPVVKDCVEPINVLQLQDRARHAYPPEQCDASVLINGNEVTSSHEIRRLDHLPCLESGQVVEGGAGLLLCVRITGSTRFMTRGSDKVVIISAHL